MLEALTVAFDRLLMGEIGWKFDALTVAFDPLLMGEIRLKIRGWLEVL